MPADKRKRAESIPLRAGRDPLRLGSYFLSVSLMKAQKASHSYFDALTVWRAACTAINVTQGWGTVDSSLQWKLVRRNIANMTT